MNLGERYKALKRREREEWAAEIAQFGGIEPKRRYDEVAARRKVANELPTSDLENLQFEEELHSPTLKLTFLVRVNGKVNIAKSLDEKQLSEVDFWAVERIYDAETKKHDIPGRKVTKCLAVIRPLGTRSANVLETFDDFSEGEWNKVYNAVLKVCTKRQKTKASFELKVSVNALKKAELKDIKSEQSTRHLRILSSLINLF